MAEQTLTLPSSSGSFALACRLLDLRCRAMTSCDYCDHKIAEFLMHIENDNGHRLRRTRPKFVVMPAREAAAEGWRPCNLWMNFAADSLQIAQ